MLFDSSIRASLKQPPCPGIGFEAHFRYPRRRACGTIEAMKNHPSSPLLAVFFLLIACGPTPSTPAPVPSPSATASPRATASPSASPATQASSAPSAVPASPISPPVAGKGPTALSLDKASYAPGDVITVHFSVDPASVTDKEAWVGLLPADVPHGSESENDKYDLAYDYLAGRTSGEMTFEAPAEPGQYEMRMHDSDNEGHEIAAVAFTVTGSPKPISGNALVLNKSRFAPGEQITVTVSIKAEDKLDESAWVGIVPAAVEHGDETVNDRYNLGYQYMGKYLSGRMTFAAPKAPGLYDLRLHNTDTNGVELAFVSFLVE